MDGCLVAARADSVVSATFERKGISVCIAEGTLTVATNSASMEAFRSACSTVENLISLADPVELKFSGIRDVATA